MGGLLELVLPRRCAGCQAAGDVLCARCRRELERVPYRMAPSVDAFVPVFALGPYSGAHRGVVLAMKERGNLAVRAHCGAVLGAALAHLEARGEIPAGAGLVPAPTRPRSARRRGGDPVEAMCRASGRATYPVLYLRDSARDQAELSAAERRANLAGAVAWRGAVPPGDLVVVDDVVTTGATLGASVATLLGRAAHVRACVALCAA
ncbi:ComF family protein [Corynebacterium liangguodongii]|uniref:Phosphoribosyltransferase n=1 Tax=Corynebacterium liangguodongii TaxID=2079535 RepID=A0A2S0WH05_9CORY|nr:ComF family protein [Corynebacterium liangguodongii]AWB85006.1 phosphoribosyltransferase [Corynebacterium liangguodongii]PWC00677.1 ComF family protein [Corynebacterium liangguodongii]